MHLGLSMRMELRPEMCLEHRLEHVLPVQNWSLLDAYQSAVNKKPFFHEIQRDVSEFSLEEKLKIIDSENELFKYHYFEIPGSNQSSYYKIHLTPHLNQGYPKRFHLFPMSRNLDESLKKLFIRIPKSEFDFTNFVIEGMGEFQRIARAIPLTQIYQEVKQSLERQGSSLDEAVVVGIDRGGRLPSYILRGILGKDESYTLKVDQSGGILDEETLEHMVKDKTFQGRFAVFVDSTVDSGRQIRILREYFSQQKWKKRLGHRGWIVMGSNDRGKNLSNHRNINWGFDPDQAFEDNPLLMGVDYAEDSSVKVIEKPSKEALAIKNALIDVPRGIFFNIPSYKHEGQNFFGGVYLAEKNAARTLNSKSWAEIKDSPHEKVLLGVEGKAAQPHYPGGMERKKLLIIGNGSAIDLTDAEGKYLADSLSFAYDAAAGTPDGNPGFVLKKFEEKRKGSTTLYQPRFCFSDCEEDRKKTWEQIFGNVAFYGDTKDEFRRFLLFHSDAVVALGGSEGTFKEIALARALEKPLYIVSGFGPAAKAYEKSYDMSLSMNTCFYRDLDAVVQSLQKSCKPLKEEYVLYSPNKNKTPNTGQNYWEVWRGLPNLTFQSQETDAGEGLRHESKKNYIWVPPQATSAFKKNPQSLFLAMINKTDHGKIRALWIEPQDVDAHDVIQRAQELNQNEDRSYRRGG